MEVIMLRAIVINLFFLLPSIFANDISHDDWKIKEVYSLIRKSSNDFSDSKESLSDMAQKIVNHSFNFENLRVIYPMVGIEQFFLSPFIKKYQENIGKGIYHHFSRHEKRFSLKKLVNEIDFIYYTPLYNYDLINFFDFIKGSESNDKLPHFLLSVEKKEEEIKTWDEQFDFSYKKTVPKHIKNELVNRGIHSEDQVVNGMSGYCDYIYEQYKKASPNLELQFTKISEISSTIPPLSTEETYFMKDLCIIRQMYAEKSKTDLEEGLSKKKKFAIFSVHPWFLNNEVEKLFKGSSVKVLWITPFSPEEYYKFLSQYVEQNKFSEHFFGPYRSSLIKKSKNGFTKNPLMGMTLDKKKTHSH